MRVLLAAAVLVVVLAAGPTYAQQPPAQPVKPAPTGQAAPAQPAPKPGAPTQPPPAATLQSRFQEGMKYAIVNLEAVYAQSNDGRAAEAKIKAVQEQKTKELNEKNKALQAAQQKLEQGGGVMSDAARAQLQGDIERQQLDLKRLSEDADRDVQAVAQQTQGDFLRKVAPILEKVGREKQVHFIFNATPRVEGYPVQVLLWAEAGLDLTVDVIKAMDAPAAKPAAAAPATQPAPAPAPASQPPATPAPAAAPPGAGR